MAQPKKAKTKKQKEQQSPDLAPVRMPHGCPVVFGDRVHLARRGDQMVLSFIQTIPDFEKDPPESIGQVSAMAEVPLGVATQVGVLLLKQIITAGGLDDESYKNMAKDLGALTTMLEKRIAEQEKSSDKKNGK